jgi:hypothetical protein
MRCRGLGTGRPVRSPAALDPRKGAAQALTAQASKDVHVRSSKLTGEDTVDALSTCFEGFRRFDGYLTVPQSYTMPRGDQPYKRSLMITVTSKSSASSGKAQFTQEYSTMLQTSTLSVTSHPPHSLELKIWLHSLVGPRKKAIDALQEQIDFLFQKIENLRPTLRKQIDLQLREINKLRSAQNSHVPISGLATELLSEVFLSIVESGLQNGNTRFATGTFGFRQVCKHWNEVAINFPRLWVRWVPGATRAWPLFNARSKDAPIIMTWRPKSIPSSRWDILQDPTVPGRIYQLDVSGNSGQLEHVLSAFDSTPPSSASSIRLKVILNEFGLLENPQDHLTRFLPFSFPKLSKLDIENFQVDSSSPLLTTSNLTSLKLGFYYGDGPRYTLAQLSRILQKHPNLQELDLTNGATPLAESPESPIPFDLPQLVDLRLRGMAASLLGLLRHMGMSPPLYNIVLHLHCPRDPNVPALINAVSEILAIYYGSEGLGYPRKADYLTILSRPAGGRSHPAPASAPQSILKVGFTRTDELLEILPLFPLNDVQEFATDGLSLPSEKYHAIFQKVGNIPRLRLSALDIGPALKALDSCIRGVSRRDPETLCRIAYTCVDGSAQQLVPKLVSLALTRLDLLHGVVGNLLDILKGWRDHKVGLKRLVVYSCRVHSADDALEFKGLVKEIKWCDVVEMGSGYGGSEIGFNSDNPEAYPHALCSRGPDEDSNPDDPDKWERALLSDSY